MFVNFLENNQFCKAVTKNESMIRKLEQFRVWLLQQYNSYKQELFKLSILNPSDLQLPAIRTIIEVNILYLFLFFFNSNDLMMI